MKARQQVLNVGTIQASMRAPIDALTEEDPGLYVVGRPIGFTPSPRFPRYKTVLEAMADGWRLLAPPSLADDGLWDWWLVREVAVGQ